MSTQETPVRTGRETAEPDFDAIKTRQQATWACFAEVTSTDYVAALLEQGLHRAEAERLLITPRVADAERLPFADESFDVALSTYGVMFAPNQTQAARELRRERNAHRGEALVVHAEYLEVVITK